LSDAREARVQYGTADIVEEDVDAVGCLLAQLVIEPSGLVVNGRVEAKLLDQHPAFLLAAGDTDDFGSLDLRDLADGCADAACGTGDEHSVSLADLSDVEQPEVRVRPVSPRTPRYTAGVSRSVIWIL
jgi:hypothetical protein